MHARWAIFKHSANNKQNGYHHDHTVNTKHDAFLTVFERMHNIRYCQDNINTLPIMKGGTFQVHRSVFTRSPKRLNPRSSKSLSCITYARSEPPKLFIFGLGYCGLAAANYFQTHKGYTVYGTCRTEEKTEVLKSRGFHAFTYDADGYQQLNHQALQALQQSTHILSTVPPDGNTDPILMAHSRDIISQAESLTWVGYISSTSVYGDHKGSWVDESSDLLAAHGKGLVRMLAETSWLALSSKYNAPVHILRCGGIYGPRRSALDALKKKSIIEMSDNQVRRSMKRYTSRCHVYDICRVLEESMKKPRSGAVYNVVDDDPASRQDVMEFASDVLVREMAYALHEMPHDTRTRAGQSGGGLDSIRSVDDDIVNSVKNNIKTAEAIASTSNNSNNNNDRVMIGGEKRVKNSLIKKEFGITLEFPSYKEGITAIAKGDYRPFHE